GARVGRRDDIGRQSLAATEVAISERLAEPSRRGDTLGDGRKAQDCRYLNATESVNVGRIGDVSRSPVSHCATSGKEDHRTGRAVKPLPQTDGFYCVQQAISKGRQRPAEEEAHGQGGGPWCTIARG